MKLNELAPAAGARKARKRLGRGVGSGTGSTAGRGNKGHNARSGGGVRPGFEGGQMPIHRRLPKRGFTNVFKRRMAIVNLGDLKRFEAGSMVDESTLAAANLVKGSHDGVKLLGRGTIDVPLAVRLHAVSAGARTKIEAAGGTVEVI